MTGLPFLLAALLSITGGCGTSDHSTSQKLTFNINESLLGEKYSDSFLDFSFSPPKGCTRMPDDYISRVNEVRKKENTFDIQPYAFFFNEQIQFACLISLLPTLTDTDNALNEYNRAILTQSDQSSVKQNVFSHNGLTLHQSLIMNNEKVQFKLVIPRQFSKSFQIDYIIPRTNYEKNIKAIESSIGSITPK